MANNFQIIVSATDKATATIKRINEAISKIARPISEVQRIGKSVGKELGFEKMGKSMSGMGKAATDVSNGIRSIIAPLTAVIGIGSVAGVVELTKKWGQMGLEIGHTSRILGISSRELQILRGATRLAGLEDTAMTSSLQAMGTAMQDAIMGRGNAPAVTSIMDRLGLSTKTFADKSVTATAKMLMLSKAFANSNMEAATKRTAAGILGITSILPLLLQGPEAIKANMAEYEKSGAILGDSAEKSGRAMARLMESLKKIGDTVAEFVSPAIAFLANHVDILRGVLVGAGVVIGAAFIATTGLVGAGVVAIGALAIAGADLCAHWHEYGDQWHDVWNSMAEVVNVVIRAVNKVATAVNKVPFMNFGMIREMKIVESGATRIARRWDTAPAAKAAPGAASPSAGALNLLDLVRKLEGSGDRAVSPKGAVGRYQITPDTARTYGGDVNQLTNPSYSEMLAGKILADLSKRYSGDTQATLVAYNAGPGVANRWLKSGRNMAVLPGETQKYLTHAQSLMAQTGPSVATPYASGVTGAIPGATAGAGGNGAVTVTVAFQNVPRGTKVNANSSGNVIVNTKIGYAMPEYGAM